MFIVLLLLIMVSKGKSLISKSQTVFNNRFSYKAQPINQLLSDIESRKVDKIVFSPHMDEVVSQAKQLGSKKTYDYKTTKINHYTSEYLTETALKNNVNTVFLEQPVPSLVQTIAGGTMQLVGGFLVPYLLLVVGFNFMRRSGLMGGNNPFSTGSIDKDIQEDRNLVQRANITLSSFAGSPEIFRECTEVVSYLKNETLYKAAGAEIPRGVLLEGPPGTGKTLLAKAIASEADANFISIAGSEFVEIFVGVGASKVRDLFQKARNNKPCIIFIDEIDAVGRQRGAGVNFANDEREQTLNQLLAEMDGFADNDGILVIAATNRRDVLDNALLRPGRFDRIIMVSLPDTKSRRDILDVHRKSKKLDYDVDLDTVAELTQGFSGAQLKNLLNEAAIFAARNDRQSISNENLLSALDKLIVGIVKENDERSYETRRRVAIHESGHALLAQTFSDYFELKKVSIQSTYNGAGGYTIFNEKKEISEGGLYTKDLLIKRLAIAMGGKAAETIIYGEKHVSMGAIQDLKQANDLAKKMIGNFGMGDKLDVFYNDNVEGANTPFLGRSLSSGESYSERTKDIFDKEVLCLVKDAFDTAKDVLLENKDKMNAMVEQLMEKQILIQKDLE